MPWDWTEDFNTDEWPIPFKPPRDRPESLTVRDIEQLARQDEELSEYWKNFLLFLRLRLPENSSKRNAVERHIASRKQT